MMVAALCVALLTAVSIAVSMLTWFLTLTLLKLIHRDINRKNQQRLLLKEASILSGYDFQDFSLMCEQNDNLVDLYNELGQSIAALNIQLQVAQKLWQSDPNQAQESVCEAYLLSGTIMREVRETVRNLNRKNCN